MIRKNIKGFTLKGFGYSLEVVFVNYLIKAVALSKPLNKTLWRLER